MKPSVEALVFLDADTFGEGIDFSSILELSRLPTVFGATPTSQVLERVKNAEVIVTNKVVINREVIEQCKSLKLICVTATGVNNVDVSAASECGVMVTNVTNYGANAVAQHVFGLILSLSNNLPAYMNDVRTGVWSEQDNFCLLHHPMFELNGKTLGIYGYGEIAKSVEKIASGFGMRVLISERKGITEPRSGRVSFEKWLRESDVLTLHCPLTNETANLISQNEFIAMKSRALLVNAARGGIVDEAALVDALRHGDIAACATDVLSEEPPNLDHTLLKYTGKNLLITPHCAWAAIEARQRLIQIVAKNIQGFLSHQPQNIVN